MLLLKVPGAAESSALASIARFVCRIYLVYIHARLHHTEHRTKPRRRFVSQPSAYEFGGGRTGCKPASSFRTSLVRGVSLSFLFPFFNPLSLYVDWPMRAVSPLAPRKICTLLLRPPRGLGDNDALVMSWGGDGDGREP